MRWHQFIVSALSLGTAATAAKSSSTAVPRKLDDITYKSLAASQRNHSAVILLTALDARFGCQLCRDFSPDWELLAKSWTQGEKQQDAASAPNLVFGTLDFSDGRQTFMSLGLQSAPVLILFQPTTGPFASPKSREPVRYDFSGGQTAETVHAWLSKQLPDRPHPPLQRPVNYARIILSTVITLAAGGVVIKFWGMILPVITNRNLWSIASVCAVLIFTCGHMFNQIRKVPYIAGDGHGGVTWITPGFQNQLGMETQIVGAIYGIMAFAIIQLACKSPRNANPRIQQVTILIWSFLIFVVYGYLLSVFRIKNGGYPYKLPPFM